MDPWVQILLAVIGTILLGIGGYIARSLGKLTEGVQELNVKIAVVISQLSQHEDRLKRLEDKP